MDLGCPLLRGSSDRRLRKHVATVTAVNFVCENCVKTKGKGVKTVQWRHLLIIYTVKLARAKLSANAGNFTCRPHVKRPHTQFTCVTCSLPVKRGIFTCVYAVSTLRRIPEELLAAECKIT